MDRKEWIDRCAARYRDRAGLTDQVAQAAAEASLESLGSDLTESPEDAADEDLTCWQD